MRFLVEAGARLRDLLKVKRWPALLILRPRGGASRWQVTVQSDGPAETLSMLL